VHYSTDSFSPHLTNVVTRLARLSHYGNAAFYRLPIISTLLFAGPHASSVLAPYPPLVAGFIKTGGSRSSSSITKPFCNAADNSFCCNRALSYCPNQLQPCAHHRQRPNCWDSHHNQCLCHRSCQPVPQHSSPCNNSFSQFYVRNLSCSHGPHLQPALGEWNGCFSSSSISSIGSPDLDFLDSTVSSSIIDDNQVFLQQNNYHNPVVSHSCCYLAHAPPASLQMPAESFDLPLQNFQSGDLDFDFSQLTEDLFTPDVTPNATSISSSPVNLDLDFSLMTEGAFTPDTSPTWTSSSSSPVNIDMSLDPNLCPSPEIPELEFSMPWLDATFDMASYDAFSQDMLSGFLGNHISSKSNAIMSMCTAPVQSTMDEDSSHA
jgi:hypothetical protein